MSEQARIAELEKKITDLEQQLADAEQLSHGNDSRLADFANNSSFWFWETDANHIMTMITPNVEAEIGIPPSQIVGTIRVKAAAGSLDDPKWRVHWEDILAHKEFSDFCYDRPDASGTLHHVSISGWPVFDDHGNFAGYRGLGFNKTEELRRKHEHETRLKELNEEIERGRETLEMFLENLSYAVMWTDMDGNVIHLSKEAANTFSMTEEQYASVKTLDQHIRIFAERGDLGPYNNQTELEELIRDRFELVNSSAETGYTRITELKSIGKTLSVTASALTETGRIFTWIDISEQTKADRLLAEAMNALNDPFVLYDKDDKLVLANQAWRELYEDVGRNAKAGDHRRDLTLAVAKAGYVPEAHGREEAWTDQIIEEIDDADGRGREIQLQNGRWTLHRDQRLAAGELIGIRSDITEMKWREEEIRQANEQLAKANAHLETRVEQRTRELRKLQKDLVESERKSLMAELVSSLCHELRNPLNALNTSLYIIRSKTGSDERIAKALDRSDRTVGRCRMILDDLYDFSLSHGFSPQSINIMAWIEEQSSKVRLPDDIQFDVKTSAAKIDLPIDEQMLNKAVWKVLRNGIQALNDETQAIDRPKHLSITCQQVGGRVEIIVKDNGPGMDKDVLGRALELLYSTRGFGVGLGLPICEQSFKRHGGGLEVSSTPDEGTAVTMWLPLSLPKDDAHKTEAAA